MKAISGIVLGALVVALAGCGGSPSVSDLGQSAKDLSGSATLGDRSGDSLLSTGVDDYTDTSSQNTAVNIAGNSQTDTFNLQVGKGANHPLHMSVSAFGINADCSTLGIVAIKASGILAMSVGSSIVTTGSSDFNCQVSRTQDDTLTWPAGCIVIQHPSTSVWTFTSNACTAGLAENSTNEGNLSASFLTTFTAS